MNSFEGIPNPQSDLKKLFEADQEDRKNGLNESNPEVFAQREENRYQKAQEMFAQYEKNRTLLSAEDVYYLAFLFQHGRTSEDYKKAHELALEAEKQGSEDAKWLSAATEDRYLFSLGKAQKWGTQFIQTKNGWEYAAPLEEDAISGVTDEMRQNKNVPVRGDQLKEISKLSLGE
jgi:hypothetical protein